MAGKRGRPQDVEVVNLAEQILHVLEVVAPGLVFLRKEIFDDVTKTFDADAQGMKCNLRAIAQGAGVKIAGRSPAFEREVLEYRTTWPNAGGAERKNLAPLTPLFEVEFVECGAGFVLLLGFA